MKKLISHLAGILLIAITFSACQQNLSPTQSTENTKASSTSQVQIQVGGEEQLSEQQKENSTSSTETINTDLNTNLTKNLELKETVTGETPQVNVPETQLPPLNLKGLIYKESGFIPGDITAKTGMTLILVNDSPAEVQFKMTGCASEFGTDLKVASGQTHSIILQKAQTCQLSVKDKSVKITVD